METLVGNIQYEMREDGELVLEIDTTKDGTLSKSGKSVVKASTDEPCVHLGVDL